jgi:cytochrome c oxidase assembly factor CtaG
MHPTLEPLTWARVFTSWRADPLALTLVAVLGAGYWWARRRAGAWPRARSTAFLGIGLGGLLLVSVTFIGVYADTLFWVRAVQVILLLMTVPLGLAMGAPVTLVREGLSEAGRARLDRLVATRPVRVLTHPAGGSVLMLATPWLLYFSNWYPDALRSGVVDALTRLALPVIGFVYFYGRLQVDPVPRRHPHLLGAAISIAEGLIDAALGLTLWLNPHLVAGDYYAALHRAWGPSPRYDQIVGAGVLWLGGDLAGLPFLGALMRRMGVDENERAAEIDRDLDETEAALVISRDDDKPDEPVMLRPWWEDDPELSERFRRDTSG